MADCFKNLQKRQIRQAIFGQIKITYFLLVFAKGYRNLIARLIVEILFREIKRVVLYVFPQIWSHFV